MTERAIDLGRKAALAGRPITDNPFIKPGAWLRWRTGYGTAKSEETYREGHKAMTREEAWKKVLNEIATFRDVETQDRLLKVIGEYGQACADDMFERMRNLHTTLEKIST